VTSTAEVAEFPTASTGFGVPEPAQQFVLDAVSWEQYETILEVLGERPGLRLTYDCGRLEFMSKTLLHGRLGALIALLIHVIAEECNITLGCAGETTLRLKLAKKGLEPDQCFYTSNWPAIRGKDRLNLPDDPPPDLAVEIDVTRSSLDRMGIYAGLGVPEIWRWVGGALRVYQLNSDSSYDESDESTAFLPGFPVNELLPFLEIARIQDDPAMTRAFRKWFQKWITDRGLTA
jgi:Uma2 family endonuclease